MPWTAPDVESPDGPSTGPDEPMLRGYLDWQRATLGRICAGLTAEQLAARPIPSTNLSLLGLLRHLTKVECIWFRTRVAGQDVAPAYPLGDDLEFRDLSPSDAAGAVRAHRDEVEAARAAIADVDFDTEIVVHGEPMSLRMITLHVIAEYARHNGHADLLREAIDGVTGR